MRLLFPGDPVIADNAIIFGALCNLVASALFLRRFLFLPNKYPGLDRVMLATGLVPLLTITLVPLSTKALDTVVIASCYFSIITAILIAAIRYRQNYKPARYIIAGNLVILIPGVTYHFLSIDMIPTTIITNLFNIAAVIQMSILAAGLGSRIDNINKKLIKEVSDRKLREQKLIHVQKIAHYGDWSWNTSTNEFIFSQSALDILPKLPSKYSNNYDKLLSIASEEERIKINIAFSQAAKSKTGFEAEFCLAHHDGSTHYYLSQSEFQLNTKGQPSSLLIGTLHDITDSKLADIAQRENEQRWRELADSTFEAILIYQNNIIIDANQACKQLLGFYPQELIGTSGETIIDKAELPAVLHAINTPKNIAYEFNLINNGASNITPNKRHQPSNTTVELRSKQGIFNNQASQIVAIRDISQQRQHEEQLRHLGHYDSLTELANRSLFQERLQHAIDQSARTSKKHALLL